MIKYWIFNKPVLSIVSEHSICSTSISPSCGQKLVLLCLVPSDLPTLGPRVKDGWGFDPLAFISPSFHNIFQGRIPLYRDRIAAQFPLRLHCILHVVHNFVPLIYLFHRVFCFSELFPRIRETRLCFLSSLLLFLILFLFILLFLLLFIFLFLLLFSWPIK
uniref:Uncharacterized protein n=1 Tax=Cacopsylla melanoneura TaxID=428564 RepID=A0A8D8XHF8_9HEMI